MSVSLVTSLADAPMITPSANLPSSAVEMAASSLLQMSGAAETFDPTAVICTIDPSSTVSSAAAASPSPSSTDSKDDGNTGTCHGPPGLKGAPWFASGRWPGEIGEDEISCNSNFNNVTSACCDEVGGESKMGAECGLIVCKIANSTEAELTACFEKHEAKSGCQRPRPSTPATTASRAAAATGTDSSAAGRIAAGLAITLFAGSVALSMAL